MPSSAVPNTDLPSPDLPGPGLPGPDLPSDDLPSDDLSGDDLPGADLPETETGSGPGLGAPGPSATLLRCDGCGASAVIDQDEHRYGGLVRAFLGQHTGCGNAVQITRTHAGND
jgi:hypothetical protein